QLLFGDPQCLLTDPLLACSQRHTQFYEETFSASNDFSRGADFNHGLLWKGVSKHPGRPLGRGRFHQQVQPAVAGWKTGVPLSGASSAGALSGDCSVNKGVFKQSGAVQILAAKYTKRKRVVATVRCVNSGTVSDSSRSNNSSQQFKLYAIMLSWK
ncbi:MAG: hypothetical protein ACK58M_15030, partial [Acidobacteriota bacterium]